MKRLSISTHWISEIPGQIYITIEKNVESFYGVLRYAKVRQVGKPTEKGGTLTAFNSQCLGHLHALKYYIFLKYMLLRYCAAIL